MDYNFTLLIFLWSWTLGVVYTDLLLGVILKATEVISFITMAVNPYPRYTHNNHFQNCKNTLENGHKSPLGLLEVGDTLVRQGSALGIGSKETTTRCILMWRTKPVLSYRALKQPQPLTPTRYEI